MTAYLPPTKFGYNDPTKTKPECNINEAMISIVILSFFEKILKAKNKEKISIKIKAIKIVSLPVRLNLL